jgi:DNA gyrase/topoisomerase IV subunit B
VLPLRGKILNCEDQTTVKALANAEIADLVTAIGTGAGDKFHYDGLRYGKIILLMDADSDGCHISTLLLDFFFRHMHDLVKKGHVYLAQPPLFRLNVGRGDAVGAGRRAQGRDQSRAEGERQDRRDAVQGARRNGREGPGPHDPRPEVPHATEGGR